MKNLPVDILDAFRNNDLDTFKSFEFSTGKEYGTKGKTLLHIAVKYTSSLEIIRYIIRKLGISARSTCSATRTTALHYACRRGYLPIIKYLVEDCKANVNAVMKGKLTPVLLAAQHCTTDVVFYLISKGANVKQIDIKGWGLVHYAAKSGNYELLLALEQYGISMHSKTKINEMPIHIAAQSGNIEVVKLFMALGQDIYSYDSKGKNIIEHSHDWYTVHWILSNTLWVIMKEKVIISLLKLKAPLEILVHYCRDYLKLGHAIIFDREDIIEYLLRNRFINFDMLRSCSMGKNVTNWVIKHKKWHQNRGLIYIYNFFKEYSVGQEEPYFIAKLPKSLIREISSYI